MTEIKEELPIEDRVYSTYKLPVLQAIPIHAKFMKALGEGLGKGLATVEMTDSVESIGVNILSCLTQADTEAITSMIPDVLASVYINEKRLDQGSISNHFNTFPQDIYPVFAWALAVNISPFLKGSGQGWKAFTNHLGLKSRKDGKEPGSHGGQSSKVSAATKPFPDRPLK